MYVQKTFILEILGAARKKQWYCLFLEHPVYSISKMFNVLILVFIFWFDTIHLKCMWKSQIFLKKI